MFFKNMKGVLSIIKILIITFIAIFIFFLLAYIQYTTPKIVRKEIISNFNNIGIVNKPEAEEDFIIKYRDKEVYLGRFVFSNNEISSNFYKEFLSSIGNYSAEDIEIEGYPGLILKEKQEKNAIILKKNNIVIIASCEEKNCLIKVVEWFIEKY